MGKSGSKVRIWKITISSEILTKNFKEAEKRYKLKIDKKQNNAIDCQIVVEDKVLRKMKKSYIESGTLEKDSRHKFFIKLKTGDQTGCLNFYLKDIVSAESNVYRSSDPTCGKDFLK